MQSFGMLKLVVHTEPLGFKGSNALLHLCVNHFPYICNPAAEKERIQVGLEAGMTESLQRTSCGLDDRGMGARFPPGARDFSISILSDYRAHPASYTMGTGDCFPACSAAGKCR
jgi:hypothetical protein